MLCAVFWLRVLRFACLCFSVYVFCLLYFVLSFCAVLLCVCLFSLVCWVAIWVYLWMLVVAVKA